VTFEMGLASQPEIDGVRRPRSTDVLTTNGPATERGTERSAVPYAGSTEIAMQKGRALRRPNRRCWPRV
jgi:hypothetical protein